MREHPCREVTEYQGSPVALQVTAIAKVPKGAGAIFRQKRKKRKSPINVASNLLPESPVSLAHGGEVHHVIFNRRAYSSRIRVPSRKKTFATLSDQKRFSSRYGNTAHQWRRKCLAPDQREQGGFDYGFSLHQSGHRTLCGVRVASTMIR
jgi:hypothetical protein